MRAEDIQAGMVLYYTFPEEQRRPEPGCVVRIVHVRVPRGMKPDALVYMERVDGNLRGIMTARLELLSPLDPGIAALYGFDMKEG